MNGYRIIKCLSVLFFLSALCHAQKSAEKKPSSIFRDTVLLMNGEKIITMVLDSSPSFVKIVRPGKKDKMIILDSERIFSVSFANGSQKIYYRQDTTIGNDLTIADTRFFIAGEQDADKGYRSTFTTVGAAAVGVASGSLYNLLSLVPPFLYSCGVLIPKVKIKRNTVSNQDYLRNDAYVVGYQRVAQKKRTLNALKSGAVGLVAGFLITAQLKK